MMNRGLFILFLLSATLEVAMGAQARKVPSQPKYLLLDSRIIERAKGLRLALGTVEKERRNPLFAEDKPWEPRFDNLYANVVFDEEEGIYKCWYSPFIIDERTTSTPREKRPSLNYLRVRPNRREMGVCYATSKDGIAWEKPKLGLVEFNGSTENNIVLRGPHGAGVMKDRRDPSLSRRYKMFFKRRHMSVAFSPDGLHWSRPIACPAMAARGDTHNNAFWAPELNRYVGITRLWKGQRIVGRTESRDFVKWTKAVEVLRALPAERHRQTYAMPVFRYASVYLGLVMMINTDSDTVDCELAWSPDTVRWGRVCPGRSLIPRGLKGSYDWGCIYAAAYPVVLKDEIRIYYGGNNGKHTSWRDGFFCLARLRPDGFACMEPESPKAVGTILTRAVACVGKNLRVSADAAGGSLRVGVVGAKGLGLEDCEPVVANVTNGLVTWKGRPDLSELVGKPIQLRFELKAARLYTFSFTKE